MKCTGCGSTTTYIDRPGHPDGTKIVHWRKCLVCGHRFETVETPKEDYDKMEMRAINFQTIVSPEARAKAKAMIDEILVNNAING
jgi:transcriptional regulator NrdR family protein